MSVSSSGAFPVYGRASTLRSASRLGREFPCRGCAPAVTRDLSSPDQCPGIGSLVQVVNVPPPPIGSPALLGLSTGRVCRARDRPDETRELARDRGDGDGLELASPDQRSVAPVEAALRLPGD